MNINNLVAVLFTTVFVGVFTASAHDSHTHTAPWEACEEKKKSEQCSFTNGDGDLFKGSCQLFSEALMCVRNQPIIHAEDLAEEVKKKHMAKDTADL
jgi:hypothetical protein